MSTVLSSMVPLRSHEHSSVYALGICLIAFLPHIYDTVPEERNRLLTFMEKILGENKNLPFQIMWAQGGDNYEFEQKLTMNYGYPSACAISISKNVVATMKGAFNERNLRKFVIGLMTGRESLSPLYELPDVKTSEPWDGENHSPEVRGVWLWRLLSLLGL